MPSAPTPSPTPPPMATATPTPPPALLLCATLRRRPSCGASPTWCSRRERTARRRCQTVTGNNYLLATDLSGTLTLTQVPTNSAALPLGTNVVVITVADASGNASYSTNEIIVLDQTPPVVLLQPQSQTNIVGASAGFSVTAAACTPLTFQWYFDNTTLAAQTNSTLTLSNLQTNAGATISSSSPPRAAPPPAVSPL